MEEDNKEEDLITIVIPIYKVEKYLKKCINSVSKAAGKVMKK